MVHKYSVRRRRELTSGLVTVLRLLTTALSLALTDSADVAFDKRTHKTVNVLAVWKNVYASTTTVLFTEHAGHVHCSNATAATDSDPCDRVIALLSF